MHEIRQVLGISRERMARMLDVSSKTVERWEISNSAPSNRSARERFAQLQEIVDLGSKVYTSDGLSEFLKKPLPAFRGRSAMKLIELGESEEVFAELAAVYEGGLGS